MLQLQQQLMREVGEELGLRQMEGEEEEDLRAIPTIPELQLALDTLQRSLLPRGFSHHSFLINFQRRLIPPSPRVSNEHKLTIFLQKIQCM